MSQRASMASGPADAALSTKATSGSRNSSSPKALISMLRPRSSSLARAGAAAASPPSALDTPSPDAAVSRARLILYPQAPPQPPSARSMPPPPPRAGRRAISAPPDRGPMRIGPDQLASLDPAPCVEQAALPRPEPLQPQVLAVRHAEGHHRARKNPSCAERYQCRRTEARLDQLASTDSARA